MITFFDNFNLSFVLITLSSFLVALVVVLTKDSHLHCTAKGHAGLEVQSMHKAPTPRIGGVAFVTGTLIALLLLTGEAFSLLALMLVAGLPVFVVGLCEDIGIGARPYKRLLAAMISSLIMVLVTGATIDRGVAPYIDQALAVTLIGAVFTIIVATSISHAFNLIDGLNGLAMSVAVISLVSLSFIALRFDDHAVALLATVIALSILGVFFVNFPFGKIFLGDAGAYLIGFMVAWVAILLMERNPDISRWSMLLVIFWPFVDTTFAVLRRVLKGVSIAAPDKLHFHHLVLRTILRHGKAKSRSAANPVASSLVMPLAVIPAILAVVASDSRGLSILFLGLCTVGYLVARLGLVAAFRQTPQEAYRSSVAAIEKIQPATPSNRLDEAVLD
ncbi:putative undecaprenyl-phosphate N-acetylglucosaminyl 1-phosphate transferase [Falsiruegeria litorea R37]|uniref:Putative undecaprenyl-phosphate N-acetylglucosaminyl 1-phosphate transferase n=1 Tax=Falsiruegeria litorea R37 TaxID=1200284 RepID=A0A1Y5U1F3_9RHOB|nr:putative undecaprenyl-phosphate N-acetylglucosaminyl 1-phosphate transferase [Falsiruegeria litorea R37]